MTKIIRHRGAAGLAPENQSKSFVSTPSSKADVIEFDVHLTKDRQVVVLHDKHTGHIANESWLVREKTLAELQALELKKDQYLPTLDQVLTKLAGTAVIIDIKDDGVAEKLVSILAKHPDVSPSFASFEFEELLTLRRLIPEAKLYVLKHSRPLKIVLDAYRINAVGVGLNKWMLNPLTYWLLRRRRMEVYIYTVNSRLGGRLIRTFYPAVDICTDYPELFA